MGHSCLVTNAFTKGGPNHDFLFLLMAMADLFWPRGAMAEWSP